MAIEDTGGIDELEMRRNGSQPPTLPSDASLEDVVSALNATMRLLARVADDQAREMQLVRLAVQQHGTRLEMFCRRIENALEKGGGHAAQEG